MKHSFPRVAVFVTVFFILSGCAPMEIASRSDEPRLLSAQRQESLTVSWEGGSAECLSEHERGLLDMLLRAELQKAIAETGGRKSVYASIRKVETISPVVNVVSALLLFIPVDRGGVAIDFVIYDNIDKSAMKRLQFAEWTSRLDLGAQFSRLGPAEAGVRRAVEELRN